MASMLHWSSLLLWRALAALSLALGLIGMAVPMLPTVPFLILTAWAAGKSSPALERWLLRHPKYGHPIRLWRERGVVSRNAKWLASIGMLVSAIALWIGAAPVALRTGTPIIMAAVAVWLWLRPEA